MGFWIYKMVLVLLIPLLMTLGGKCLMESATKEISALGYRSSRSMKNKDTWKFANHYCGELWIKMGLVILIFSIVAMLFVVGGDKNEIRNFTYIVRGIQLVSLVLSAVLSERALRSNFDKQGNRII